MDMLADDIAKGVQRLTEQWQAAAVAGETVDAARDLNAITLAIGGQMFFSGAIDGALERLSEREQDLVAL